ncbi:hypothetical protein SUGI_0910800 [Cryptomeria japonica]|nr:hypothetical protein SUGI_0910800 [Cryptomeria japonica]
MNRWVGFICMLLLLLRKSPVLAQLFVAAALGWLLLQILGKRGWRECYLVDFTCYKPPAERQANAQLVIYFVARTEPIIPEHMKFQWRVFLRSGVG